MATISFEALAKDAVLALLQRGEVCEYQQFELNPKDVKTDTVSVCINSIQFSASIMFSFTRKSRAVAVLLGPDFAEDVFKDGQTSQEVDAKLQDRYSEIANMAVGRIRSMMSIDIPFTGQSTPIVLSISNLKPHLDRLTAQYECSFGIRIDDEIVVRVNALISCSDDTVLSFTKSELSNDPEGQDGSSAGFLELM
jgi:hypothetical protein